MSSLVGMQRKVSNAASFVEIRHTSETPARKAQSAERNTECGPLNPQCAKASAGRPDDSFDLWGGIRRRPQLKATGSPGRGHRILAW